MKKALETRAIIARESWYIQQIFEGVKKYDFWKNTPKYKLPSYLLCEEESRNIVGEIGVEAICRASSVDTLLGVYKHNRSALVTKQMIEEAQEYIKDEICPNVFVLLVCEIQKFTKPIPLKDFGAKKPHTFSYVAEEVYQNIIRDNERIPVQKFR